ncbi:hypothetical protein GCM10009779_46260 [Polymorphospora rubra]|uniref:Uncharacterized protein n=1 Tax=Polymorphospora rubra TaxID=338584 RepID=A0A810MQY6_9ACTN|nr:hypothetical protein [Polymorphospora rubra]BCJ63637.1 hypothetical protein Prubr_06580 [Polymorphospora rubra]
MRIEPLLLLDVEADRLATKIRKEGDQLIRVVDGLDGYHADGREGYACISQSTDSSRSQVEGLPSRSVDAQQVTRLRSVDRNTDAKPVLVEEVDPPLLDQGGIRLDAVDDTAGHSQHFKRLQQPPHMLDRRG